MKDSHEYDRISTKILKLSLSYISTPLILYMQQDAFHWYISH